MSESDTYWPGGRNAVLITFKSLPFHLETQHLGSVAQVPLLIKSLTTFLIYTSTARLLKVSMGIYLYHANDRRKVHEKLRRSNATGNKKAEKSLLSRRNELINKKAAARLQTETGNVPAWRLSASLLPVKAIKQ